MNNMDNIDNIDKYCNLDKDDLFPNLINDFNLKIGIEIGVRDGCFAKKLLEKTKIILYGSDIRDHELINSLSSQYKDRYFFSRCPSPNYASCFYDDFFDFIYIDADHTYNSVKDDINAWWPKLKTGGIFSGDDYAILNNPTEGAYGIVQALEEWLDYNKFSVYISELNTTEKNARIEYANKIGKQIEDNLFLIHDYMLPKESLIGRKRTENVHIPQWWLQK